MTKIPILTLRLLDIKIPNEPDTKKLLLNGAKDLAREHKKLFVKKGIDINIFHNDDIQYSGIQLGRYQGAVEWTAIGKDEVKAIKLWYKLFRKQSELMLENTVEIKEKYTPAFLKYQKKYQTKPFLINDDVAKELNDIDDKFARIDRLEKYLYGNFMPFFKHLGVEHDRNTNFLKITVVNIKNHNRSLPVYHQNKKTALDIIFKCNFRLPQTLSLGQSTALGYGKVQHM